jgi:hypothetical protein
MDIRLPAIDVRGTFAEDAKAEAVVRGAIAELLPIEHGVADPLERWRTAWILAYATFAGRVGHAIDTLTPDNVWYDPTRTLEVLQRADEELRGAKERASAEFETAIGRHEVVTR